jgi:uncharacterized membrane protein YedE/YeeE
VFSKALGTAFTAIAIGMGMFRNVLSCPNKEETNCKNDKPGDEIDYEKKVLGGAISGFLFALGLAISGMTKKSKVHDFLCPMAIARGTFDPSLLAVLGSAIGVSWLGYLFVDGHGTPKPNNLATCTMKKPLCDAEWSIPTNQIIDRELLTGASIFGFGWSLTGCKYCTIA